MYRLFACDRHKSTGFVFGSIVTGTFAEKAVAPTLTRGTSIYELRIAKISIPAGTTEITEDLITDTRFDDNDCGNVICAVTNPDFTNILNQYIALWDSLIETQTEDFEKWFNERSADFASWFNEIKNQLIDYACGISQHLRIANTIFPSYMSEFEERRLEMDRAMACCNALQDEF